MDGCQGWNTIVRSQDPQKQDPRKTPMLSDDQATQVLLNLVSNRTVMELIKKSGC
jgi:hypothetical protein